MLLTKMTMRLMILLTAFTGPLVAAFQSSSSSPSPAIEIFSSRSVRAIHLFTSSRMSTAKFASGLAVSSNNEALVIIDNVFGHCGVRPPTDYRSNPLVKQFARWTWRQRVSVLKVLHWRDPWTPVNSCINLECLWWKVLSTTDPSSPCFESSMEYTYDLLPRPSRRLVRLLRRWHPRWIHALLELRMAYLNQAIESERQQNQFLDLDQKATSSSSSTTAPQCRVRTISLGAGYDVRSIRLLNQPASASSDSYCTNQRQPIIECFEFDLPSTIESKRQLIQERLAKRQQKRRQRKGGKEESTTLKMPTMIGLDLNDTLELQRQLKIIFGSFEDNKCGNEDQLEEFSQHTIFVVEGVLMYLDLGKGAAVLQACSEAAKSTGGEKLSASLCFADRLFDRSDCDPVPMQEELAQTGWKLYEWAPNPSANAKHMGIARLLP